MSKQAKSAQVSTPAEQHMAELLRGGITSSELLSKTFPPRRWLVPDLLPAWGMTVVGAKMGIGKSYFLLQLAGALSTGTPFLRRGTERQGVLFITLEDDEQTIQERMNKLGIIGTDMLEIRTTWAKGKSALEDLRLLLASKTETRVVIIDPIVKFIDLIDFNDYSGAYGAMGPIKDILDGRHVAGLFSHHCKKAPSELDAFDELLGSTGIGGACDTRAILRRPRDSEEGTLIVGGRGVRYSDSAVLFDADHGWQYQGTAEDVRMSDARKEILELLEEAGPLAATEISKRLEKNYKTTSNLLRKLLENGKIVLDSGKKYHKAIGSVGTWELIVPTLPTVPIVPIVPIVPTGKEEEENSLSLSLTRKSPARAPLAFCSSTAEGRRTRTGVPSVLPPSRAPRALQAPVTFATILRRRLAEAHVLITHAQTEETIAELNALEVACDEYLDWALAKWAERGRQPDQLLADLIDWKLSGEWLDLQKAPKGTQKAL